MSDLKLKEAFTHMQEFVMHNVRRALASKERTGFRPLVFVFEVGDYVVASQPDADWIIPAMIDLPIFTYTGADQRVLVQLGVMFGVAKSKVIGCFLTTESEKEDKIRIDGGTLEQRRLMKCDVCRGDKGRILSISDPTPVLLNDPDSPLIPAFWQGYMHGLKGVMDERSQTERSHG